MKASFSYYSHVINCDDVGVSCETCSVPMVIALACQFMHACAVKSLIIDRVELTRIS